ncbi:sulfite exporter TauE/SafE family protein [Shouchella shacheensis]|uniref:sulfite exporter TauE/SafE family protein n=1 Tax=Shouchella shacheensis TaxID=1649580 RepID=UPI0007401B39|nr:sulfite exporter TauE/SafE family protein [Shouchella shacheensis]
MEPGLLFVCIILAASLLQTSTGFGFSIMATPFLLLLFAPEEAVQLNIILSILISLSLITKIRTDVERALLKRLFLGSIVGVPFGLLVFTFMNILALKLGLGLLLLLLTSLLIGNVAMKQTPFRDVVVGGLSGVLTASIGMPGPPLLLYFVGTNMKKEVLRATTLAFFLFIYTVSLVTQMAFAGTKAFVWQSSLVALPFLFIGLFLGQLLFKRLNQRVFKWFTYVLLIGTGMYLLIESIGAIYFR